MKKKGMWPRIVAVCLALMLGIPMVPMSAAATETPYYQTNGTSYKVNSDDPAFGGTPDCFDIYMYGNTTNGTGTLDNGAIINWDDVTVYLDAHKKHDEGIYFYIDNLTTGDRYGYSGQNMLQGDDKILFMGSLADGHHRLVYMSRYEWSVLFLSFTEEYVYNFDFYVDTHPPIISGASTSVTYTNQGFTVSASDRVSGVKTLWYAEPGDTVYKAASSDSITFPAGSKQGYYYFYAVDEANNRTDIHYVYHDYTKPTGAIKNVHDEELSVFTNESFKYAATDTGSGIAYRKIWEPVDKEWKDYNGSYITTADMEGQYWFYAVDGAGNKSEMKSIQLDTTPPTGTLYGDTTVVANGGKIAAEYVKFIAKDNLSGVENLYVKVPGMRDYMAYTNGSKLSTKGTYYFYSTDYAGNTSSTYSVTLLKEPTETYSVSYYANGGRLPPATQVKIHNKELILSSTVPIRDGYIFRGWGISSDATTVSYRPGDTYTENKNLILYAIWEITDGQYTVVYHANGGSGAPDSQIKYVSVDLTLSSKIPVKEGYTFLGWSESATAVSPSYVAGGTYTADASAVLYAVWLRQTGQYTVTYNAMGGSGAPAAQIKTEGVDLLLSSTVPTREGYDFLGWSTSASSPEIAYQPGDLYTADASANLYAVWEAVNYDFSVSDLCIDPDEGIRQFETMMLSFRVDSWDSRNDYKNIPVEVLLNGVPVYATKVDIPAYGIKFFEFDLNVGASLGLQTLEVRVNWDDHYRETRTDNNAVDVTFEVTKVTETAMGNVAITGDYVAGHDVISSFYIHNEGAEAVLPRDEVYVDFEVYRMDANGDKTVIAEQTKHRVVIPGNGTNLVYFKWTVPTDHVGERYYCRGRISESPGEQNVANNVAEFSVVSTSLFPSVTPDTRYEAHPPAGYAPLASAPLTKTEQASWNEWVYENGDLVLKTYGITVSGAVPSLKPGVGCTTAEHNGSVWTMKSGYGVTLTWNPVILAATDCEMPSTDAYTGIQSAYALFPEYAYSTVNGQYNTLDKTASGYCFAHNSDAADDERLHFIPVYVADGNYTVSVTVSHIWTPAGIITTTRNANTVRIEGTVYDDWYQG